MPLFQPLWQRVPKVGGHVAANFFIHNPFALLMLNHNFKVGGQRLRVPESRKTVRSKGQRLRKIPGNLSPHSAASRQLLGTFSPQTLSKNFS
jgi:hypothetical protein